MPNSKNQKEKDFFKIVAVIKKKRIEYTYVPHKWEKDGSLYWPQANLSALRADPSTEPAEDWKKYMCKVKKSNIFGLEEAELWEKQFVDEGTDVEGCTLEDLSRKKSVTKTPREIRLPPNPVSVTAFDEQFAVINAEINSHCTAAPEAGADNVLILDNLPTWIYPEERNLDSSPPTIMPSTQGETKLEEILLNQKKIIEAQERMAQRMDSEFTQQKATYDKIYRMLRDLQLKGGKSDDLLNVEDQRDEKEDFNKKIIFPLASVEDIFDLNKEIGKNTDYRKYLLKTYTSVGGTEGIEEGKIIAKKLRTIFFTEHVLTLFSWTGVSRTPGMAKKQSFQICDNIIGLFLEILCLANNRWSATKNEKFFKYNTLKHARQSEQASNKKKMKQKEPSTSDPLICDGVTENATSDPAIEELLRDEQYFEENTDVEEALI